MSSQTSAGTLLKVSAVAPATYNAAGYAALAYTAVGEVTNLGEFGKKFNLVRHNPLATRGTVKKKGSYDDGQISVEMALDRSDAGQTLMRTARDSDANYFFEVTFQDGTKSWFPAVVMGFVVGVGSVDDITSATADIEITNVNGVGIVESV